MKLIIAGSRTFDFGWYDIDRAICISRLPEIVTEVVCGTAKGIDLAGKEWANEDWKQDYPTSSHNGPIPVKEFPADWNTHGKAAGPIRNKQMAEYADALLLIWDGESKGSANMKREMEKLGKPVYEVIIRNSK
jgi:hypothetical protein